MIKININEVHEDFIKRYGGNTFGLRTFSICSDLTVLGNGFEKSDEAYYSLPLSIRTYITLRITDNNNFSFQESDSNTEYTCSTSELLSPKENKKEKDIFCAIAHSRINCSGAQILFSYDAVSGAYKKNIPAIYTSLKFINSGKPAQSSEIKNTFIKKDNSDNFSCELSGRKNFLISSDYDNTFEYLPFNLSGYKIILASFSLKQENTEKNLLPYIKNKKNNTNLHPKSFVDNYEKYTVNEMNRIKRIKDSLKSAAAPLKDVFDELTSSAYEYCDISQKNGTLIKNMIKSASASGFAEAVIPAVKYSSIAIIVKDENVDGFISEFSHSGEKVSGSEIKFYITDTENSGTEIISNKSDK